jgi:hypothetical protein
MRELKPRFYIVSAHRFSETGETNHNRNANLENAIRALRLNFKPVTGVWEGEREASFLILDNGPDWRAWDGSDTFDCVKGLADAFDQDSFLERHPDGSVEIHYTSALTHDGFSEFIGQWVEAEPNEGECYTHDPSTGRTYVAR